jgi:hypothetical protein
MAYFKNITYVEMMTTEKAKNMLECEKSIE